MIIKPKAKIVPILAILLILIVTVVSVAIVNTGTGNAEQTQKATYTVYRQETVYQEPAETYTTPEISVTAKAPTAPTVPVVIVPPSEIELVAKVLAGECYEYQIEDKRNVVKVICNRAATGGWFGDTIEEVVTKPHQFEGYWHQSRPVSESDIAVATEILTEWYSDGCGIFSPGYLYFTGTGGKTNEFRIDW